MDIYDPESPTEDDGLENDKNATPESAVNLGNEFEFDLADVPLPPGAAPMPISIPVWSTENSAGRSKKKKKKKKKNKDGSARQEEMYEDPLFGYPPPLPPAALLPPPPPPSVPPPPPPSVASPRPPLTTFSLTSAASALAGFMGSALAVSSITSPVLPAGAAPSAPSPCLSSPSTPLVISSQEKQLLVEGTEETRDEPLSLAKQLLNKALGGVSGKGDTSSPSRDEEIARQTVGSSVTAGKLKFSLKPPGSSNLQKVSFQIRTKKATLKSAEEGGEDETVISASSSVSEAAVMPVRFKKSKQELFRPDLVVGEELDVADLLMQEQMRIASHSLVAMQAVALLEKSRQAAAEKELAHKSSPDVKLRSPESKSRRVERKDRRSTREDKKEDNRESSEKSRKEGRDKNTKDDGLKDKQQHEHSLGGEEEKPKGSNKEGADNSYLKESRIRADGDMSIEEEVKEGGGVQFSQQSKDCAEPSPIENLVKAGNRFDTLASAVDAKAEELDEAKCVQSVVDVFVEDMDLSPDIFAGDEDDSLKNVTETVTARTQQIPDLEISQTDFISEEKPCSNTVDQVNQKESVYSGKLEKESKTATYLEESECLRKAASSKGTSENIKNLDQDKEVPQTGEEEPASLGSVEAVPQSKSDAYDCTSKKVDRKYDVDVSGGGEKDFKQPEDKIDAEKDKSTMQPESQSGGGSAKKDSGKKNESHKRPGSREKDRVRNRNRSRSRSGSREKNHSRAKTWQRSRSSSRDRDRTRKFSSRHGSRERGERRRRNRSRSGSRETERSSRRRRSSSPEKERSKKKEERSSRPTRDREKEKGKDRHKSDPSDLSVKEPRELHSETGDKDRGVLGKNDKSTSRSGTGPQELPSSAQVSEDDKQGLNNTVEGIEERKGRSDSEKRKTKMSSRDVEERKQKTRSSSLEGDTEKPSKDRDSCERTDKTDMNKEMSKTSDQKAGSQSPRHAERAHHREWQLQNTVQSNKNSRCQSRSPERVQRRNRRRRSSSSDRNERSASGRYRSRSRSGSREQRLARQCGGSDSEEEFFRRRALDWSRDQAYLHYKRRKRSDSSDEEKIPSKSIVVTKIPHSVQASSKDQSPPTALAGSLKSDEQAVMQVDLADILLPGEIPDQQLQTDHAKESKTNEILSGNQGEEDMDLDESFSDSGEPCLESQQQENMHHISEDNENLPSEQKTMEKIGGSSEAIKVSKPPEKIQFSLKSFGKGLKLKPRTVEDLDDEDLAGKSSKLFLPQELDRKEEQSAACIYSGPEKVHSRLKANSVEATWCNEEKDLKRSDSMSAGDNVEVKAHSSEKTTDHAQKPLGLKNAAEETNLQESVNFESNFVSEDMSECSSLAALENDGCERSWKEDTDESFQESLDCQNAKTVGSSTESTKPRGRLFKYEPLWELDKKESKPRAEFPVVVPRASSMPSHDKAKPGLPISLGLDYGSSSEGEDSEGSIQKSSLQKSFRQSRRERNESGPASTICHRDGSEIPSKSPEVCVETSFHVSPQESSADQDCGGLPKVVNQKLLGKSLDGDEAPVSGLMENILIQIEGEEVENSSKWADTRNKFQVDQEKTFCEETSKIMPEVTNSDMNAETYFQKESFANPEKTDFDSRPFIEKSELEKSSKASVERAGCPESSGPNRDRKRVRKSRFSDRSPPRSLDTVEGAGALELTSSLQETYKSESAMKGTDLESVCLPMSQKKSTGEEGKKFPGTKRASRFGPPVQPFEEGLKETESHQKDMEQSLTPEIIDNQNSGPERMHTMLNANSVQDYSGEQEKDLADPFSFTSVSIDTQPELSLSQNVDRRNNPVSLTCPPAVISGECDDKDLMVEKLNSCESISFDPLFRNGGNASSELLPAPTGLVKCSVAGSDGLSQKLRKKVDPESPESVCSSAVKTLICDLPSTSVQEINSKDRDVYQDPEISTPTEEPIPEMEMSKRKPDDSSLAFHNVHRQDDSSLAPVLCSESTAFAVKEESDEAFRSVQRAVFLAEKNMESPDSQTAVTREKTVIEPGKLSQEQPKLLDSRQSTSCVLKSTLSSHSLEILSSAAESTTDGSIYKQHQPLKVKDPLSKTFQRHLIPVETVASVKPSATKMSEPVFDSSGGIVKTGKIQIIIGKKVAAASGYLPENENKKQNTAPEPAGGFPVQVVTSTRNAEGLRSELIWPDCRAVAAKEVDDARAEKESKSSSSSDTEESTEESTEEEQEEEEESEQDDQQDTPGLTDKRKPDSYDSHRRDSPRRHERSDGRGDHRHRELSLDDNQKCTRWDVGDDRERRRTSDERIRRQSEDDHRRERERLDDRHREKEEEDRKRRDRERERERDRDRRERERERGRHREEERRRRMSRQSSTERSFHRSERSRRRSQSPDWRKARSRERSQERAGSTEQSYQRNDRNKRIQSPDWRRGRSQEQSQERGSSTEKSYQRSNRNRRRSQSPDWRRGRSQERSQERASSIEPSYERNNRNRRRSQSPDWRRGRNQEQSKERASSIEKAYQRRDRNRRSRSPNWQRGRSREQSQERASSLEQSYRRNHDRRISRSQSPIWKRGRSRERSQEGASDCDRDKAKENRDRRRDGRERTRHNSQDRVASESCKERVLDWNHDRNYDHSRDRSGDFILGRTRDEIQNKMCEDSREKPIDCVMQDHVRQRSHEYVRSRMHETSLDRTGDYYSEEVCSHSQERVTERNSSGGHDYSQGVPWNCAEHVPEDVDCERLGRHRDHSGSCSREKELRVNDQKWDKREATFPMVAAEVQTYNQSFEAVQPAVLSTAVPFYPSDPVYQVSQEATITGQLVKQNQGYDVYAKVYPEQPSAGWAPPLPATVDIASLHVVQQNYQALGYPPEQALSLAHQYLAGDPAARVAYTQTHVDPSAYTTQSTSPYVSGSTTYAESYPPGVLSMEFGHSLAPGGDYSHAQHSSYRAETLPQGYPGTVVSAAQFSYESLAEMEAHLQAEMNPDPREAALFGDLPSFRKPRNSKKQRVALLPTPPLALSRLQTEKKSESSGEQTYNMDQTLNTVVSSEPEFATSSLAEPTFESPDLDEGSLAKRCLVDERPEKDGDEVVSSTNSSVDASESALKDDLHFGSSESKPMKVKSRWRRSSEAEGVVEASLSSTTSEPLANESGKELGGDQDVDSVPPPPPPSKCMPTEAEEKQVHDKRPSATDSYPVFEVITENIHLTQRKKSKSMKRMVCDCTTSKNDRAMGIAACGSDCLNRMLMIECGSRCPCLDYCTNKRFQKKQYCKTVPFNAGVGKGWGLRAAEDLPEKGAFVMEYVGELLDYKEFVRRTRQYARQGLKHHYFMALNADEVIDATQKGSTSRFMNHSCDPNCETQKWTVNGELRVGFFTKKPVAAGEELTFDYQFEFYGEPQKCYCGSEKCRGFIGGQKLSPARKRKDKTAEKRKMELFEDEMLDEDIQQMCQLKEGMRNKKHVLELCRLMVRAEKQEHRLAILQIIQDTTEMNCLSLFLGYHGLPLLWSWMMDIGSGDSDEEKLLKKQVLQVLSMLPINNKTILKESKIMPIVEKWASLLPPPLPPEQEADSVCEPLPLPVPPSKPVISILACSKDYKEPKASKKRVTFADETTSSDSDLSDTLRISSTSSTNGDQSGESAVSTSNLSSTMTPSVNEEDGKNIQKEIVSSLEGDSLTSSIASLEPDGTKQQEVENAESAIAAEEDDKVEAPVTRRRSGRRSQTPQCEDTESKGRVLRSSRRKRFSSEETSQVVDSTSQRQEDVGKTEVKNDSDGTLEGLGTSAEADTSSTNKDSLGKSDKEQSGMPACATSLSSQEKDDGGIGWDSTASLDCVGVLTESQTTGGDSSGANQAEAQSSQTAEIESVVSGTVISSMHGMDDGTEKCSRLADCCEDPESSQETQSSEKGSELGETADDGGKPASDVLPVEFESADEITLLAVNLLQGWSELKELYKIPKKQRVEERKRTERELESVVFKEPEKREMDPYAKWKRKTAAKPRKKDMEEEELKKRNLVLVGPRMSKEERRQLFEAQVKAEDEMAEMQRQQQEAIQQQQQQQQHQEAAFFLQQNPAFVSILHGLAAGDPSVVGAQGQVLDPSLLYGAGVLTPEQQQAAAAFAGLLNAPGMSGDAATAAQQLLAHHSPFPLDQYQVSGVYQQPSATAVFPDAAVTQQLALQHLALQQMAQRQQPFQAAAEPPRSEEEDVPPPPSPPKSKEPVLPPNWKTARDGEGRLYYYHTVTRQTQWDPPSWESNSPEDMDFDLPDQELEPDEKSKKKTTTAAADTSSEVAKKIKDQFRRQMSQFVVVYLNPYRKPDCKVGRITSTEEFKHLARKLTHHVMAKELKHCRHVEDLEVNENVKAKAKDYVRKYMSRFGALYKKTMSPQPEDL